MKIFGLTLGLVPVALGAGEIEFEKPVRLRGGDELVKVDSPGYACPTWADVNGDGRPDLLVGQFSGGKIRVFLNEGGEGVPRLGAGKWLEADGKVAEVPGVW